MATSMAGATPWLTDEVRGTTPHHLLSALRHAGYQAGDLCGAAEAPLTAPFRCQA